MLIFNYLNISKFVQVHEERDIFCRKLWVQSFLVEHISLNLYLKLLLVSSVQIRDSENILLVKKWNINKNNDANNLNFKLVQIIFKIINKYVINEITLWFDF